MLILLTIIKTKIIMHELLKDLTIVVPTKNRPLVTRVLNTIQNIILRKILIADSSDERLLSQIKASP